MSDDLEPLPLTRRAGMIVGAAVCLASAFGIAVSITITVIADGAPVDRTPIFFGVAVASLLVFVGTLLFGFSRYPPYEEMDRRPASPDQGQDLI